MSRPIECPAQRARYLAAWRTRRDAEAARRVVEGVARVSEALAEGGPLAALVTLAAEEVWMATHYAQPPPIHDGEAVALERP